MFLHYVDVNKITKPSFCQAIQAFEQKRLSLIKEKYPYFSNRWELGQNDMVVEM
jgi:hypothetical protein